MKDQDQGKRKEIREKTNKGCKSKSDKTNREARRAGHGLACMARGADLAPFVIRVDGGGSISPPNCHSRNVVKKPSVVHQIIS